MPKQRSRRPRSQARIPGLRRLPMGTAVGLKLETAVRKEMARYGVSRSCVIANALSYTFDIPLEDTYK